MVGMTRRKNPRLRSGDARYAGLPKPVLHRLFRALADPTRLRLLNLVGGSEVCVCYLVEVLGLKQPKISRHLAYLRRAGLVAVRRQGKWMHYRLALPKDRVAAQILLGTLEAMQNDPRMRYDLAHLSAACCSPEKYEVPQGAPMPEALHAIEDAPFFPSPNG
jgi:ArsR family transcriptional regulator, arsenate/arsenite/antimonite-responsive transcriptional repressor